MNIRSIPLLMFLLLWTLTTPVAAAQQSSPETPDPFKFEERRGGWKPFWATIFMGARVGLEYNEGRDWRPSEIIRGIPVLGFVVMLPKFCAEALSLTKMQHIANETGIDELKKQRYEQAIVRLRASGQHELANDLARQSPFLEANYPDRPRRLGTRMKAGMIELFMGHRQALEWNEGRGLRTVEWWDILIVPRIFPALEAFRGEQMMDIAQEENLDSPLINVVLPR